MRFKGVSATAYAQKPAGNLSSPSWKLHRAPWGGAMYQGEQGPPGWEARGTAERTWEGGKGEPPSICLLQPGRGRQAAAMTRSWTGLVPEQAPWLWAHHTGEAPEGHIARWSVGSTQHHVLRAASACCLVSNHSIQFAPLPHT